MRNKTYFKIAILMAILAIINLFINYETILIQTNMNIYVICIVVVISAVSIYFIDIFVVTLVTYFFNAILGCIVDIKKTFNIVGNALLCLPYIVIVNNILLLTPYKNIVLDRKWLLKIIYLPMYIIIFIKMKNKLLEETRNKTVSTMSALVGSATLFIMTGI